VILPALPVPVMDAGAIFFRLIFFLLLEMEFLKVLLLELLSWEPLLVPKFRDQQFCNFSYWRIT
jgi:hypothetical protein